MYRDIKAGTAHLDHSHLRPSHLNTVHNNRSQKWTSNSTSRVSPTGLITIYSISVQYTGTFATTSHQTILCQMTWNSTIALTSQPLGLNITLWTIFFPGQMRDPLLATSCDIQVPEGLASIDAGQNAFRPGRTSCFRINNRSPCSRDSARWCRGGGIQRRPRATHCRRPIILCRTFRMLVCRDARTIFASCVLV